MSRPVCRARSLIVFFVGAALCASAPALADRADEALAKIKAAYLLNFIRFATWPPESFNDVDGVLAPIVTIVLGDDRDGVGTLLSEMIGDKEIRGRRVRVRQHRFPNGSDPQTQRNEMEELFAELASAHLLYIEGSLLEVTPYIAKRARAGLLLVGDGPSFARRGGMLSLVLDGTRVVFEANLGALDRGGVQLSSKVLKLARIVPEGDGQ